MKLPNGDRPIIPIEKLTGYCLNPNHAKGKHKARVFQAVLNINANNADVLYSLIQQAAIDGNVVQQDTTPRGEIFKVDWEIPDTDGRELRTTWEIANDSEAPRLVTAFIKSS
jgi:hypothetical protein